MKFRVSIVLFIVNFFSVSCAFGQGKTDSLILVSGSFQEPFLNKTDFRFMKQNFKPSDYTLQVFNPTLGFYENYRWIDAGEFEKSEKMSFLYTSNSFFNSHSAAVFSAFSNGKIDSFNPSGVSDMESALGIGLLNLIFGKTTFRLKN